MLPAVVVMDRVKPMVDLGVVRVMVRKVRSGQDSMLMVVNGLDVVLVVVRVVQLGMMVHSVPRVVTLCVVVSSTMVLMLLVAGFAVIMGDIIVAMSVMVGSKGWLVLMMSVYDLVVVGVNNSFVMRLLNNDVLGVDGDLMVAIVVDVLVVVLSCHCVVFVIVDSRLRSVVLVSDLMTSFRMAVTLNRMGVVMLNGAAVMITSHLNPVIVSLGHDLMRSLNDLMMS